MNKTFMQKQALEAIRDWIDGRNIYPPSYFQFFFHWTLLNLCYNASSDKREEVQRVLEFGRSHERLWNEEIAGLTRELVSTECVGDGKGEALPSDHILAATRQLRQRLSIEHELICSKCRKKDRCRKSSPINYNFSNLEGVVRILYQIRCNLFHGDKTEIGDRVQRKRNDLLIDVGNNILEDLLRDI